jgi:hypothetical protein
MQLFIALAATILLALSGPWLASIFRKQSKTRNISQNKRSTKSNTNQASVLMSMLVEFQEAQCFFMLATQIAVLVSFRNQSKFYEPENYAQLDMDNYLGQIIGAAGLIPVSIVMFTLNIGDMSSWYILSLSGITLATSSATVIISNSISIYGNTAADLASFYNVSPLQACGNHPPPIIFCDTVWSKTTTNTQNYLENILGFIYIGPIIIFSVILFQFVLSLPLVSRKAKKLLPQVYRLKGSKTATYIKILWFLAVSLFYLFAIYVYLGNMYFLSFFGAIDTANWGLGQIIAVTIWSPVIFKYIYSAICKSIPFAVYS